MTEFVNAQEIAAQNPETFRVHDLNLLREAIAPGMFVKVATGDERFWVLVLDTDGDKISASVANELLHYDQHGLVYEQKVEIGYENVYDIADWDASSALATDEEKSENMQMVHAECN